MDGGWDEVVTQGEHLDEGGGASGVTEIVMVQASSNRWTRGRLNGDDAGFFLVYYLVSREG